MDAIWWVIWSAIIFTGVAFGIVWIIKKIIFKHKVRLIDLAKQNGLELDFKARDYNKLGVRYWQLDKERNKELMNMPIPPAGAINIAKRGKKSVTAIRTETGEYIFLDRKINLSIIPELKNIPQYILNVKDEIKRKNLITEYRKLVLKKFRLKNKGILLQETYQPFTSKQRMVIVNNFEKAHARKGFSLKEHVPTMVSIGALVMIFIALMIFWGDIAEPAIRSKEQTKQIVEIQKETVEILREIKTGQQKIISEQARDGG